MAATIAIVDDDEPIVTFMCHLFESEGYHTLSWSRGEGAHALIQHEQPQLVVLDLWLEQHETGWNLLQSLRADPQTAHIPIILCSADITSLRARDSANGGSQYTLIEKPFDVDALLDKVAGLLHVS